MLDCMSDTGLPRGGFTTDSIIKVVQGERVGTLFHQDASKWALPKEVSARCMAVSARECSRRLQSLSSEERKKILLDIANALEANEKLIRIENEADVSAAQQAGYEKSLISRLTLKPGKARDYEFMFFSLISFLANSIRVLADMEDPICRVLKRTELADGLILEKTSCPLGVLLIVFESRPDALVQIASLAVRSGNGLLLKGGKEAMRSNAILHKVITGAIPDVVGEKLIGLVTSRDEIPDLLKLDDVIDLVIPRGSNKLVTQIKESTKIPVLGHADGICHVYIDKSADMQMAKCIVLDAKTDYPAACNAMETLLVHKDLLKTEGLNDLLTELKSEGVALYGGSIASLEYGIPEAPSFHHEYNSMACTIEVVDDIHSAIDHIHQYGSAHTDCIVTEDLAAAEIFLHQVDSAAVFHNASTRFCDGARFGLGAEEVTPATESMRWTSVIANPLAMVNLVFLLSSRSKSSRESKAAILEAELLIWRRITRLLAFARTDSWAAEVAVTSLWERSMAVGGILRGNGQVVDGDKGVVYTHRNLPL
ncbi:Amino acid kinase family [Musa troglodytarum]|uniref:Amino acid kinase family n=1 Tax=Musa troglodytarum TaxID=320322 RepID=A0A9E7LG67_9LILI|nr:Amino acid kinase family [Musa troglodytarum]